MTCAVKKKISTIFSNNLSSTISSNMSTSSYLSCIQVIPRIVSWYFLLLLLLFFFKSWQMLGTFFFSLFFCLEKLEVIDFLRVVPNTFEILSRVHPKFFLIIGKKSLIVSPMNFYCIIGISQTKMKFPVPCSKKAPHHLCLA